MKYILLATFMICCLYTKAQTDSSTVIIKQMRTAMYNSGTEMMKFSNQYYTGLAMTGGGIVLTGLSFALGTTSYGSTSPAIGVFAIGSVLSIVGTIYSISAHSHINRAGIQLRGAGITMEIPKRRTR